MARTQIQYMTFDEQGRSVERTRNASAHEEAYLADRANETELRRRLHEALIANRAFLSSSSRTNAEIAQQVLALTRQINSLARLALSDLGGTD